MTQKSAKKIFLGILFVVIFVSFLATAENFYKKQIRSFFDKYFPTSITQQKIVTTEENVVINVVKEVGPSVVTVSATSPRRRVFELSPFGGFRQGIEGGQEHDIGSGFILSENGLIATNKHVVADDSLTYKVITSDGKSFDVKEVNKDPNNDLAIIKIDAGNLTPVKLGDSSNLLVGQFAIAIGTALGEFRNTVTTGVISGLGRGIDAGDEYQGYVERLDNVIQTDAAINPGNSGGPLLNSSGEVVGINVAVAAEAQNIGFAIPINTVKDALSEFNKTGKFPSKAYLGVQYQMITKQAAILNEVPEGAYVVEVVPGSPAESAGMKEGDIIFKVNGTAISGEDGLAKIISSKKVGDKLQLEIWRDGENKNFEITLTEFED
jgi:serine protease Do